MATLFTLTHRLAEALGVRRGGTATGGTVATLLDTARLEPTNLYTGGCLWARTGNHANKSFAVISWSKTTKTFTVATQASVFAAGNLYYCSPWNYPRDILIARINDVLKNVVLEDVSLVTVANQEDYTLAAGVSHLLRVEVASYDAAPYYYVPHFNWEEKPGGKLRFATDHEPSSAGLKLRLYYQPFAITELDTDDDTIDDTIPLDWVVWNAAVEVLRWRAEQEEGKDEFVLGKLNEAIGKAAAVNAQTPFPDFPRDPKYANW